jgi:hypothetical protein
MTSILPPVDPHRSYKAVFVLPVSKTINTEPSVYEATRRSWKVSRENRQIDGALAVALTEGVSHAVFSIEKWTPYDEKFEFTGQRLEGHELEARSWGAVIKPVSGFFRYGNYLIVEFLGRGQFRFIRPSTHGEQVYMLAATV